jgi:hypothetical protein
LPFLGQRFGQGPVHQRNQQTPADREADAFGLGHAGKGGEAVVVEEEGVGTQGLQFGDAVAEGVGLFAKLLELSLGVVAVERLQDGGSVAVESLSGKSELVGALGDLAVGPVENSGGVGDTEFGR